jgi:hypothetical protein
MEALLKKLEAYDFECEAGSLKHCQDWHALRAALTAQPADTPTKSIPCCCEPGSSCEMVEGILPCAIVDKSGGFKDKPNGA